MEMEQSNWVHLPNDLLDQVLDKLFLFPKPSDYFNFGLACKSWLTAAAENAQTLPKHDLNYRVPVIALSSQVDPTINFFSDQGDKICELLHPERGGLRICGSSSQGWLALSGMNKEIRSCLELSLFNPVQNRTIDLPIVECDALGFQKVAISALDDSSPISKSNYVVAMATSYTSVAFIKPGDRDWTYGDTILEQIADVIFYKGRLYAVDLNTTTVVSADVPCSSPQPAIQTRILPPADPHAHARECYFAESTNGNLMLIVKYYGTEAGNFKAFRLMDNDATWVETKDLNDDVVFLDQIGAVCVKVTSDCSRYKRNCIYIAGDYSLASKYDVSSLGMGVYMVADGSLKRRGKQQASYSGDFSYESPTWVFQELPEFRWEKGVDRTTRLIDFPR